MGDRGFLNVRATEGVPPPKVQPTSLDLRLDRITEAKVWDIDAYKARVGASGDDEPVLHVGSLRYKYVTARPAFGPEGGCPNRRETLSSGSQAPSVPFARVGSGRCWQSG